ncbi:PREDICTED: beta-1,3-galactosyltransferase 5-like, partial [Branchiostoma belcheri]|uniref:Hexosyltransferase n=1 Tax=Branchiostoma belcheri TaxID=7741 RepID=A0A6P4Y484_BRABE
LNPQPLNPQPIDPQPLNPQPFNPQPFNLKPLNPQPLNPQPLNPRPSNTTEVINPHPYKFTINNPGKCSKDVFLLIMVISAPGDADLRHAIRKTWGQETIDPDIVMKTVFTVGIPNNASVQKNLEHENTLNQDIIQEDFVDSYRNLTLKTVMCLKWASEFCPGAKFVMKVDDDTFVNIYSLVRHLKRLFANKTTRLVTGHVNSGVEPIRDSNATEKFRRWYISTKDYPWETFPDYASGLAYVMSGDVVRPLYEASWTVKYLFLEDVFLGHCMEKLGIKPVHHGGFIPYQDWTTPYCTSVELLAAHWSKIPGSIYAAWSRLSNMCVGVASINDDKLYEWQNLIKQQQAKKARLNL